MNQLFNASMINQFDGDKFATQEKGPGRTETRLCMVEHNVEALGDICQEWLELNTIGVLVSIRQEDRVRS